MNKAGWIVLVLLAGALLPVQAGMNTRMGRVLDSPAWASLVSFGVGLVAMVLYVGVTRQGLATAALGQVPGYSWIAGALGAFYVTTVVIAFPKLGAPLTFGLIVAGQLMMSLLLEHFDVLVHARHAITWQRLLGLLLIVGGVVLIRRA